MPYVDPHAGSLGRSAGQSAGRGTGQNAGRGIGSGAGQPIADAFKGLPAARTRLAFFFALLTAAGGVVLASGQSNEAVAAIAIVSAILGFALVDWLRWFELPPAGAYLAMGGAAAYCVYSFWGLQQHGQPQMASVALLLVLVQGILMLQRKSRRILEQMAVFCLLELVVAAIFNDAIHFGFLMIPIAVVGGYALSLLGLVTSMEQIEVDLDRPLPAEPQTRREKVWQWVFGRPQPPARRSSVVEVASPESARSVYHASIAWSRFALVTLTPAVLLIAGAFFYVLPRKVEPSRAAISGPALVGFDDQVRLEQLGRVMQNSKIALKVELNTGVTSKPYRLKDSLYLRGKVLEEYTVDFSSSRPTASWVTAEPDAMVQRRALPKAPAGGWSSDAAAAERGGEVQVTITCESMSRPALFGIAPYHTDGRAPDVLHDRRRWTLSRKNDQPPFPRVRYGFLTTAFDRGTQSPWLAEVRENERRRRGFFDLGPLFGRDGRQRRMRTYLDAVLEFDRQRVPEAARLAREVMESIPPEQRTRARVARELEQFLATSPEFAYTLDLTAKPIPNVDPVQQFLAFDRRGHCQYFASALALMLRSVGIPSRVVVGYRTEEYNALGKYYIARQQHAHAWVEALIDLDEMPNGVRLPLQPRAERFWMRLDPTPAESAEDDGNREGVNGLLNLANNIWEDYVVEMDSERQSKDLVNATGLDRVQNSYRGLFDALERRLSATSRGRLSGRSLSSPGGIPVWPLLIGILAAAVFVAARHVRWPRRKARADPSAHGGEQRGTSVEFYRHALEQLRRVGIERQDHETPGELSDRVGTDFPGFAALTEIFIRHRYGHATLPAPQQLEPRLNELRSAVEAKLTQAADGTATSKRANG